MPVGRLSFMWVGRKLSGCWSSKCRKEERLSLSHQNHSIKLIFIMMFLLPSFFFFPFKLRLTRLVVAGTNKPEHFDVLTKFFHLLKGPVRAFLLAGSFPSACWEFLCLVVLPSLKCLVILSPPSGRGKENGEGTSSLPWQGNKIISPYIHWLKLVTWSCLHAWESEKCCFWLSSYFLGTTLYCRRRCINFGPQMAIFAAKNN